MYTPLKKNFVTSSGNFVNPVRRLDGILWRILLLLISVNWWGCTVMQICFICHQKLVD